MRSNLAVTTCVELVLNKVLFSTGMSDHHIKSARYRLNGKVVCVEIKELSQPITIVFSCQQVDVLSNWAGDIHCTIKAPLNVFLKLRDRQKIPSLIRAHELDVDGDTDVLQQIVALGELVSWDIADCLSPYIGDVAAYGVSHHFHLTASFIQNLLNKQENNFKEVIKEEWLMLPNPLELSYLNDRVAEFACDVDAIARRVEQLNSDDDSR